uniref:Uncharacterized protein n=1 Tax=Rhipicephalus zambeziensis TaxID=60191 RepID=A0A224YHB0_9ACAR
MIRSLGKERENTSFQRVGRQFGLGGFRWRIRVPGLGRHPRSAGRPRAGRSAPSFGGPPPSGGGADEEGPPRLPQPSEPEN